MKPLVESPIPETTEEISFIPLCVPEIRGNEWKYVKECLDTNWVSAVGSYVERFEKDMAATIGARYAVATVNGTAALHTALLVAGIKPDDEVIVSTLTFIAPANAIRYAGAWPVFIDADPRYWQMDPNKLASFLEEGCQWKDGTLINKGTGRKVRGIIPVHILGHPVDMDPVLALARKFGLVVIEDATESLGSRYRGTTVGHLADISCFSFNGNKILTTGGGGMILTDNEAYARQAKYLTTQAKDDEVEYVHHEIGYNYRLTNVLAAMGCAQLEQLAAYIEAKRRIAGEYTRELSMIPGLTPFSEASWAFWNGWMYTVVIEKDRFGIDSRELLKKLAKHKIQTRPLWQPIHLSQAHTGSFFQDCAVAEGLNRTCLSLPCSVGLKKREQQFVIEKIHEALHHA